MANGKPWLKMWTSWLGDIQLDRLSLAEQGAYWRLFSLCHDCGHVDGEGKLTGALVLGGTPLTLTEMLKSLKISEEDDKAVFLSMVDKMIAAGYFYYNGVTLYIANYEETQRATTDTKADRARRQRERRERIADDEKRKESPVPPLKEKESIDIRGQTSHGKSNGKSVTQSQDPPFTRNGNSVTDENISETLKEMMRCFEKYIGGIINSIMSAEIKELSEFFDKNGGKFEWIEKGFSAAPSNIKDQKRRWQYTQKVLQNYIDEGGPSERKQQRNEANRRSAKRHTGEEYERQTRIRRDS